eukprot:4344017-Pyramimonas_sp.AAC.1
MIPSFLFFRLLTNVLSRNRHSRRQPMRLPPLVDDGTNTDTNPVVILAAFAQLCKVCAMPLALGLTMTENCMSEWPCTR